MEQAYLRPSEFGALVGVSDAQARRLIRAGAVPAIQVGNRFKISRDAVDAFIAARATPVVGVKAQGYPCRDAPGGRCFCRCHAVRFAAQASRKKTRSDAWTFLQDEMIRVLISEALDAPAIAERLTDHFGIRRGVDAVRRRVAHLGLSLRDGWWSRSDVARMLGISVQRMQRLERQGYLGVHPHGRWRRVKEADIEAFVREHAGALFDPRRVKDPRFKTLAETAAIANRRRQAS